ncbi:MAG: alkaline phosphatase family protein [Candidatus Omnitrophica bacterium]|nr:alkaline phosphatase family protein [Candidatus Omnitrophota bacterium]
MRKLKLFLAVILLATMAQRGLSDDKTPSPKIKLYWFIPDGLRAEPETFNIYKWAQEGYLPNIKKMMDNGSYGYSRPVYPGHTPVNFATLFTGSYPEVHGVSDGTMHTEGNPLGRPSVMGFSSTAKKVEPIWVTLEKEGRKVGLLSVPGSTPPELQNGYTMVGRWGGWGANFNAIDFEEIGEGGMKKGLARSSKLFFFGPSLAVFTSARISDVNIGKSTYSTAKTVDLEAWGALVRANIYDSTDDGKENYDRVSFISGEKEIADLKEGEWSGWLPIRLKWNDVTVDSEVKVKVIRLEDNGYYKIRFYYNAMNETNTDPSFLAADMIDNAGPMVDSVDSFPAQLIFYPEDKDTFIEEASMSFDWHVKGAEYFLKKYDPDIFIHDIYTPNQMFTSRWWMGYVDPKSALYGEKNLEERDRLFREVKEIYRRVDEVMGKYLEKADEDTVVVLTSDHGIAPLSRWVNLNNYFAGKGWLKFSVDPKTGETLVDWQGSKVVYLNFGNIYIAPSGLHDRDGKWSRQKGEGYEKLREEVITALEALKDKDGASPVAFIVKWEDAEKELRLPGERVGDLIVSNKPGFGWNEEMTEGKDIFEDSLITGYKQALKSDDLPAMWVPFVIMGPGVKKGNYLGDKPFEMIDQYPTLMTLIKADMPGFVQGKPVEGVFEKSRD